MKLIIRFFGISLLTLILLVSILNSSAKSIRKTELNEATSHAVNQTQLLMRQQFESEFYGKSIDFKPITTSEEYIDTFVDFLTPSLTTKSSFSVDVFAADVEKGLLSVGVVCEYKDIFGKSQTLTVRKTSIIEITELKK